MYSKLRIDFYKDVNMIGHDFHFDDVRLEVGSYTMEDINVKKIGMAQAEERILLCDHSKFTTCALFNICTIANIDTIIVPKELDSETIEHLRRSGITVEVV